jgi:polar amino acid transport system substrate-binding protein
MAVKKGETALKDALDKAIAAMKADGSLNEVAVKWLKQPLAKDF